MITPTRLDAFLQVIEQQSPEEWSWQHVKDNQYWIVTFRKSYPPFRFFVEFNEEILYVQYIFQDFRVRFACWPALYRILLRINEELSLLKFGLTAFGKITFMGELPAEQFSLSTFHELLRLMIQNLEELYWEIGIIAEAEDLAPFLTIGEASLAFLEKGLRHDIKTIKKEELTSSK